MYLQKLNRFSALNCSTSLINVSATQGFLLSYWSIGTDPVLTQIT